MTHPHVQGGQMCLGEGSVLLRSALNEGRLYDAFVVVRQILLTYKHGSPCVALDRWHGSRCDSCDNVVPSDETYSCVTGDNIVCGGCEHRCVDCDGSYCRNCLKFKDGDLLCHSCFEDRETQEAEKQDDQDEPQTLTPAETMHAQTTT